LAALERFVYTDFDLEPLDLVAIPVDIDENISIESVNLGDLRPDWRSFPAPPALALIGEQWFRASRTAVLSVPSVVIPHERNFVLNPNRRESADLSIGRSEPFSFDPRRCGSEADHALQRVVAL
jgi:RES domain-containing protein